MQWKPATTADTLDREARRILDAAEHMSALEREAFAGALSELSWAICMTQPYPVGAEFSLSAECLDLFRKAAEMAEMERREHAYKRGHAFSSMDWRQSGGQVLAFPSRAG